MQFWSLVLYETFILKYEKCISADMRNWRQNRRYTFYFLYRKNTTTYIVLIYKTSLKYVTIYNNTANTLIDLFLNSQSYWTKKDTYLVDAMLLLSIFLPDEKQASGIMKEFKQVHQLFRFCIKSAIQKKTSKPGTYEPFIRF